MRDEIITGLDIGSTTIRMVIGQKNSAESKVQIIGAIETPSAGINRGVVTSIEDAISSISACVEKAERLIGIPIESAWVGISGPHIISESSKGVVAVSRPDGEIKEEDVSRAIEAARAVASPPNYEILHVIPKNFTVDGQGGIKDPVGMVGIRLEVEAEIIQGLSSQIKNLTKCVYRTGLDIEDLALSVLAASESLLKSRQKELGVVVINIGGATTSMAVFEEGDLLHTTVLPVGSEHITSDIAIGLRTSIDTAEKIKLDYGSCLPKEINKKDEIDLRELDLTEDGVVSKKYIAEIIEARVEEIFDKVDKELIKIEKSGLLPAGVILTGGGAKLNGIIEVAKKKLRLPAALGAPRELSGAVDKVNDLSFSVALGLVLWGMEMEKQQSRKSGFAYAISSRFKSVDKVTGQMRKWFKTLMP